MSIRSIDFQTIIPKSPEVQKIKNIEHESARNNLNINIHKSQEQNDRKLKQVNENEKTYKSKIDRDKEREKSQKDNDSKSNKDSAKKELNRKDLKSDGKVNDNSIDIRI